MKNIITLIFSLAFFCCVRTTFAQGIYLEIPSSLSGLPSSTSATVEVVLTSIQYGIGVGIPNGGTPAEPSFSEITVTKTVDISSIALQRSIATSKVPINVIKINFYKAGTGGTRVLVYQYVLEGCFFSGYSASSSEGCSNGCAGISESLSINYRKISIIDSTQPGTPRRFGYDKTTSNEF
ncbi:type VI secretion system tube protein Hcp [Spirosoma areae]